MKPGACIAAAIELLESINNVWEEGGRAPADALLAKYYRNHRYIGSKDRGAISEIIYYTLRNGGALEWCLDEAKHSLSSRSLVILVLVYDHGATLEQFDEWLNSNDKYAAPPLSDDEKLLVKLYQNTDLIHGDMPDYIRMNYPKWMESRLKDAFGENIYEAMKALNKEADVHLRANLVKATQKQVLEAMEANGMEARLTKYAPHGVALTKRGAMFATDAFKKGWFEMQDEGSQLLSALVMAKAGDKVIDFCAGAGGKTLAIAATMNNKGRLLAWDVNERRLKQMPKRLARAGVNNVQIKHIESERDSFIKRHKQTADWVLVDAPCTGSGTWRRNPDLKWRTTKTDLKEVIEIQSKILDSAARLVKPEGYLVYATCSLFSDENEDQVIKFLSSNKDFEIISCSSIFEEAKMTSGDCFKTQPHLHDMDGFFAATFRRKA